VLGPGAPTAGHIEQKLKQLLAGLLDLGVPEAVVHRALAALDLQARRQDDWDPDVSLQAGVQLEGVALLGRRVQLLAQWYRGRNPNGQFYDRAVEFFGIGLSVKSE
jgi:hypothetical protein